MCASGEGESGDVGEGVEVVERVSVKDSGDDEVVIVLSETETISLLTIPSSVVVDPGQQEDVRKTNQAYQEVCVCVCDEIMGTE